jgi:hypothetical protein
MSATTGAATDGGAALASTASRRGSHLGSAKLRDLHLGRLADIILFR